MNARELQLLSPADQERFAFLQKLDAADFDVTEWEAQFIEGFIDAPRPLTPRQREKVDQMRTNYGGRL